MAFVDQQRVDIGLEGFLLPYIRLLGIPNLCRENLGHIILDNALCPSGNTLSLAPIPMNMHLVEVAVLHGFGGQLDLPVVGSGNSLQSVFLILGPIIEITYKIDIRGCRSPFTEHPSAGCLVKTVVVIPGGEVTKGALAVFGQLTDFPQGMVMPSADGSLVWLQIGIFGNESNMLGSFGFGGSLFLWCHFLGHLFCFFLCHSAVVAYE